MRVKKFYVQTLLLLAIAGLFLGFARMVLAITNIDTTDRWAWNDVIGWIDFHDTDNVYVYADRLVGYATSSVGAIALNCDSTPNGNICAGPAGNWKVANDINGTLSGWAWSDVVGWISFNCSNTVTCGTSDYKVTVSSSTSEFAGWAWSDVVGWISFNCSNTVTCGTVDYKVKTGWVAGPITASLVSSIFDTQITGGAAINSIMWQGTQPAGTHVKFQIASSNCSNGSVNPPACNSGSWSYLGSDGSSATYYDTTGPDYPVKVRAADHNNKRYLRYKIVLESNSEQTLTPEITNVIMNWSP